MFKTLLNLGKRTPQILDRPDMTSSVTITDVNQDIKQKQKHLQQTGDMVPKNLKFCPHCMQCVYIRFDTDT